MLRAFFAFILILTFPNISNAAPQYIKNTPKIETKEQPNNRLEPHNDADKPQTLPNQLPATPLQALTEGSDGIGKPNLDKPSEDGTEF
jgi:hypothetical protein